jgi:hypothetical protein
MPYETDRKFVPFQKADEATRTVFGIVTPEAADRDGERCYYETSNTFYQKWASEQAEASHGKSIANVRKQHGKTAAGRGIKTVFDYQAREIWRTGELVDTQSARCHLRCDRPRR